MEYIYTKRIIVKKFYPPHFVNTIKLWLITITEAENEIKRLEDEIDKSNKEIENKKEQSKKIMKYFQIMRSGNTYLEYIFEAESVTDMIYRISVVEQLTEYNQKVVNELNFSVTNSPFFSYVATVVLAYNATFII